MGPTEILWGVAFPIFIGVGVALAVSDACATEFWVARLCFIVAALAVSGLTIHWLYTAYWLLSRKMIVGAVVGAILLPATIGALFWVDYRETLKKIPPELVPQQKPETAAEFPDVTLRFVYPKSPALVLVNQSGKVAHQIKWLVALWNLDLPDRTDPLPISVSTFDFIRPHLESGPQNLFGSSLVSPLLKPGNRLIGSASVQCPDCVRGRTFIVYLVWDQGGWFTEVLDMTSGAVLTPPHFTREEIFQYFRELMARVPENARIPISEGTGGTGVSIP